MKNHQLVVSQWLEQLGKERDISLLLEQDGHCIISCEDGLNCVVEVPEHLGVPAVFIYLPLIFLPNNSSEQLFLTAAALEMNLFGLLTGGCQIALDTRSNYIVLSYSTKIDTINGEVFRHILNSMLEMAPRLRERLQDINTTSSLNSMNQGRQDRFMPPSISKFNFSA
jgi:hypothetical protein